VDRPREPLPTRVEDTPPVPAAYGAALDTGLAALDLTLTPAARAAIDGQVRLLLAWTGAINLTAIRDPGAVALGHVATASARSAPASEPDAVSSTPIRRGTGAADRRSLPAARVVPEPIAKDRLPTAIAAGSPGEVARFAEALAADPGIAAGGRPDRRVAGLAS
jgi:hypothetical protein